MEAVLEYDNYKTASDNGNCSLCKQRFNEIERCPLRYPCFHVFCEKCSDSLSLDSHVVCPLKRCKSRIDFGSSITECFPVDECALALAKRWSIEKEPQSVKCRGCPDNANADIFCTVCRYCLCNRCAEAHKRELTSRSHIQIPLGEVIDINTSAFCRIPKCVKHEQKPRNYFCNAECCKVLICETCFIFDHIKHESDVKGVDDLYSGRKEKIRNGCSEVADKLLQIKGGITKVTTEIEHVIQNMTDVKNSITSTIDKYKSILDENKSDVYTQLEDIFRVKSTVLDSHQVCLKELEMIANTLISYSESAMDNANHAVFLAVADEIYQKLRQMSQCIFEDEPKAKATLECEQKSFDDFTRYTKTLLKLKNDMTDAERDMAVSLGHSAAGDEDKCDAEYQMINLLDEAVRELTGHFSEKEKVSQVSLARIESLKIQLAKLPGPNTTFESRGFPGRQSELGDLQECGNSIGNNGYLENNQEEAAPDPNKLTNDAQDDGLNIEAVLEFDNYKKASDNGKCSLCEQQFNETERCPLRYPCFHVFCEKCIDDLSPNSHAVCPVKRCKSRIDLGSSINEGFPVDDCALALATRWSIEKEPQSVKCRGCPDNANADMFCTVCRYCLCNRCAEAHKRELTSRSHIQIPLGEVIDINTSAFCRIPKCVKHEQKPRNYFCNAECCKVLICETCFIFDHIKHESDVKGVDDLYSERKEKIRNGCSEVADKLLQIQGGITNVTTEIEHVIQNMADVKNAINATIDKYKSILDENKSDVYRQLEDIFRVKSTVLGSHQDCLKELEMIANTLISYSDSAMENANHAIFLAVADEIVRKLRQTAQCIFQDEPKAKATLECQQKSFDDFARYTNTLLKLKTDMTDAEWDVAVSLGHSTAVDDDKREADNQMINLLDEAVKELTDRFLEKEKLSQVGLARIKSLKTQLGMLPGPNTTFESRGSPSGHNEFADLPEGGNNIGNNGYLGNNQEETASDHEKLTDDAQDDVFDFETGPEDFKKSPPMEQPIRPPISLGKKILIAALDLGCFSSVFGFGFSTEIGRNPLDVRSIHSFSGSRISERVSTSILFSADQTFNSFGNKALERYSEISLMEEQNSFYFFPDLRTLYLMKTPSRNTQVKERGGKSMPASCVLAAVISVFKVLLHTELEKRIGVTGVRDDDVKWVLTVPATWNSSGWKLMREAALEASISDDQLSIALSHECAYQHYQMTENNPTSRRQHSKIMILDLGGDTTYITVCENLGDGDGTLNIVHAESRKEWCGTKVIDELLALLSKIIGGESVGNSILNSWKSEAPLDYIDFRRELERKTKEIKSQGSERLSLKLPVSLKEILEKKTGEPFSPTVEKHHFGGEKVICTSDKIRLPSAARQSFLTPVVDGLVDHLRQLMDRPDISDIDTILMLGELSQAIIVQDAVRKAFPLQHFCVPLNPHLAVMHGAVLFGCQTPPASVRVARYTYGVKSATAFDPIKHTQAKICVFDGKNYCLDCFVKLIEAGQRVPFGATLTCRPVRKQQQIMDICVYTTKEKSPRFVTDHGCQQVDVVRVGIPEFAPNSNDREVQVTIRVGLCEIEVEAFVKSTNTTCKTTVDFE